MATYWSVTTIVSEPSGEVPSLNGLPEAKPLVLKPCTVRTSRSPLRSASPSTTNDELMLLKNTVGKAAPLPTRTFPDVAPVAE